LCKQGVDSALPKPDIRYTLDKLQSVGEHLCVTERNSVDAERESVKTKLLEYYERELRKETKHAFPAVVTDIKNHGMYIELTDTMAFGMVHISTLDDDFYHPSQDGRTLTGRRSGKHYSVGQSIQVQVERVDRFKRQIDFRVAATGRGERSRPRGNPRKENALSAKALTALRKQRRAERLRKGVRKKKR
jgi:ribonuclease R